MPRDIINAPLIQHVVNVALEGLSSSLVHYRPTLEAYLRRVAEDHRSVRRARRRKDDPAWAQRKFDQGCVLHRFREEERHELIESIRDQLDQLEAVAKLTSRSGACRHAAAAFLRSLSHRRGNLRSLSYEARSLIRRSEIAVLRARRHEVLRPQALIEEGPLVGKRCVSIGEVIKLGRTARNCLATSEEQWRRMASGESDVWSLHHGDRLVAILEVDRTQSRIMAALGPSNTPIRLRDAQAVARFCEAAKLELGFACEGLLPHFAAPPLLGPTAVTVGDGIALYCEWTEAVRIDLSEGAAAAILRQGLARTLTLAFDPARSCAEVILEGDDPREAVAQFGRKRLRRILRCIALGQTAPSLVQHRLLALAA